MRRRPTVAGAAAVTAALWLVGGRVLPAPPLLHPDRLAVWWRGLGPAPALFAAARAGLLLAGTVWTVAALVVLGAATVAAGGRWGAGGAEALLRLATTGGRVLGLRGAVRVWMGLAIPGAALTACSAGPSGAPTTVAAGGRHADATSQSPPAPVLTGPSRPAGQAWVPPSTTHAAPVHTTGTPAAPVPTSGAPAAPVPTAIAREAPTAPHAPARTPTPATPTRPHPSGFLSVPPRRASIPSGAGGDPAAEWTVRPGDDFWSIAEATVGEAPDPVGRSASVGHYWVRLIEANRSRLPDPRDPSLLFPGDVLTLPPP